MELTIPDNPYSTSATKNTPLNPIVIDNTAFVKATGFEPRYSAKQTMEGFRWN